MIEQVALYQTKLNLSRSVIIQLALRRWLAEQPRELGEDQISFVAGQPYRHDKVFNDYLRPDMSADETIRTLQEFEAAQKRGR